MIFDLYSFHTRTGFESSYESQPASPEEKGKWPNLFDIESPSLAACAKLSTHVLSLGER